MGDDWGRGQVKTRVLGYQHPLVGVQMIRPRHYAYVLYSTESPRVALAKSNGSCIVSIECAETRKKDNKTLAGRSQGRRKRYWRGTGVTQNTVFVDIV